MRTYARAEDEISKEMLPRKSHVVYIGWKKCTRERDLLWRREDTLVAMMMKTKWLLAIEIRLHCRQYIYVQGAPLDVWKSLVIVRTNYCYIISLIHWRKKIKQLSEKRKLLLEYQHSKILGILGTMSHFSSTPQKKNEQTKTKKAQKKKTL